MDKENIDGLSNFEEDDIEEIIEIEDNEDVTEDISDLQIGEGDDDMADDEEDYDDDDDDYDKQIIEPPRDDASIVFKGHQDEVYCIANHGRLVATGGKDDKCLVWSADEGHILFECTGHEDTVDGVTFNHDGSYLATGDLKGLVKVWDVKTGQFIWSFEISSIQWLKWHHKANLLLSGSVDGDVWLWNIPYDQTKTLPSHGSSSTCGTFFPDGKRICVGYEDGAVKIWDLKTTACLFTFSPSPRYHESHVICMDCHTSNNLVATGSWDGTVLIINSASGQLLTKYSVSSRKSNESEEEEEDRIESLAFSPNASLPYLAIGCSSGKVIIWDLNAAIPRFQSLGHMADVVSVAWHPTKNNVLMSCSVDGSIVAWDCRNGQQVTSYHGHTKRIFGFHVGSDGKEIFTASADFTARAYKVEF